MHRGNAMIRGSVLVLAVCVVGGCARLNYKPGAKSILDFTVGPDYTRASLIARNPYDANDRYTGTLTLANAPFAGEKVYLELFEHNITDRDPSVRMAAARGIANHGTPEQAMSLVVALEDETEIVRVEAARGLQRLHNPEAISALMRRSLEANEPDAQVRAECTHALGQYAELRVLTHLIRVLRDDPDLTVNNNALVALGFLTGEDFGLDSAAWNQWSVSTTDPFAGRGVYTYRYFRRNKTILEHLPLMPEPPNEVPASPAGFPPGASGGSAGAASGR